MAESVKKYFKPFLILVAFLSIFAGCTAPQSPGGGAGNTLLPVKGETPVVKNEWEDLVAAAQKEGVVVIATSLRPEARDASTKAFRDKYGIDVEWVVGRGAEVAAKIIAERNAKLYFEDIGFIGGTTFSNDLKPLGYAPSLEPMLVLPEVKDPAKWRGSQIPYVDKDKSAIIVSLMSLPFYHRNTDLVKDNEITTTLDLINPKWKDKIVVSDPSTAGNGNSWFAWTLVGVLGRDKGMQFMKDLVAEKPMVTRNERLLVEWVARGKYAIGVAPSTAVPAEFMRAGAPIAFIDVKEPRCLGFGSNLVNAFNNAPHPNAAKLFLNWVLSKEGGAVFAPASEYPSTRVDVSTEGFQPLLIPRPDDVFPETKYENYLGTKGDLRKPAEELFASLIK